MWSRVYVTVPCPSVRPSVPARAHSSITAAAGLLLWARQAGDIDRLLHGRRAPVNAGSATLSACVVAGHRLVIVVVMVGLVVAVAAAAAAVEYSLLNSHKRRNHRDVVETRS